MYIITFRASRARQERMRDACIARGNTRQSRSMYIRRKSEVRKREENHRDKTEPCMNDEQFPFLKCLKNILGT